MSAGAVPVVINAGGQREIVENDQNGFLWNSLNEMRDKTKLLMTDEALRQKMAAKAKIRAKDFSEEKFFNNLEKLLT